MTSRRLLLTTLLAMAPCGAIITPGHAVAQEEAATLRSDRAITASARAGVEYDNNALRQTGAEVSGDMLTRYLVSVDANMRRQNNLVLVTFGQGGKLFLRERAADTLLTQLALGWRHRLASRVDAGISLDLKDRTERTSLQDYNRGGAGVDTRIRFWKLALGASTGWRYFVYKPNPAASSIGPTAGAFARFDLTPTWSFNLQYQWLQRRFEAPRLTRQDDDSDDTILSIEEEVERLDLFHAVTTSASWRGPALLDIGYTFSLNKSNSYGQNLSRHNVRASLTAPLPLEFFTSVRVDLQRTRYEDPIFIDANFQIDEDNRNAATLSLGHPIGRAWEAELRYSYYTQEFGAGDDYARQTLMLGVGYTHEGLQDEN